MSEFRCIEVVNAWQITGTHEWSPQWHKLNLEGRDDRVDVWSGETGYDPVVGDWFLEHSDGALRVIPKKVFNKLYVPTWLPL